MFFVLRVHVASTCWTGGGGAGPCENAAVPGDWFGRAQAAVICIMVNDYHEATYFIRAPMPKALCSTAVMLIR